jgi:ribosome-binding protein aMBF1 (putative translation factor)
MTRTTWTQMSEGRRKALNKTDRADYDRAYAEAKLAADVGERIRAARETSGLSQRELAARMSTSQAAVARLEAGGVGATLTTLHRVAVALGLELNIDLRPSA